MIEREEYRLASGEYCVVERNYVDGDPAHPAYVTGKGILVFSQNATVDLTGAQLLPPGSIAAAQETMRHALAEQEKANRAAMVDRQREIAAAKSEVREWLVSQGLPTALIDVISR